MVTSHACMAMPYSYYLTYYLTDKPIMQAQNALKYLLEAGTVTDSMYLNGLNTA